MISCEGGQNDDVCALFLSGVVLVLLVLLLQGIDHCSGTFFYNFLLFWLGASVMLLRYWLRLHVIVICSILTYTLIEKTRCIKSVMIFQI
jgi:hypothetical protein